MNPPESGYQLFEVIGIELEYPVVNHRMEVECLVEPLFRRLAGRPASDASYEDAVFSNEMAAHVFEIKTAQPERSLPLVERQLVKGLRHVMAVLSEEFGARLLPTGMHPFMHPSDGRLWQRGGRPIYEAYARIFDVQGHGWMNVHSCHVNLPFGNEAETVLLHNAIACLIPYLPALTASSPIYEGKLGQYADNRLAFYGNNQKRIPHITGHVVPEYMTSFAQYRRDVLRRIYAELNGIDGAARLKHEWVNSRGAILRFNRRAIEIRTLDTQECVLMDLAVACFIRGALKVLVERLRDGRLALPEHQMLVEDYNRVVAEGKQARVQASHFRSALRLKGPKLRPIAVLDGLLEAAEEVTPANERHYLRLAEQRLRDGCLSERIRRLVIRQRRDRARTECIRGIYTELAGCLERNEPW